MAKIKCPKCGYTEHDGRPHDRETYHEVCVVCEAKADRAARLNALHTGTYKAGE